jgi:glutamate-ammonia-ligase adenylyltransferase
MTNGDESDADGILPREPAPLTTYDDLTPEHLAALGFEDPAHACHILRDMAGHNVPDSAFSSLLRVVSRALIESADPDRAVANLGRWTDASGNRASAYALLTSHPQATEMLLTILAASQFFANLLINTPEYLEVLTNPRIRDRERGPEPLWEDLNRRVSIMRTPNAKRDALRRFKPPEILRIGARDLLGYADHQTTTRAISDFADASLRMALQICAEEQGVPNPPFAIIAMGKHGGREVNYSSDIDLIFVHSDSPLPSEERAPSPQGISPVRGGPGEGLGVRANFNPIKLAEAVRDTMARPTDAGFVFRVDLRLRPEGRFGPISRSIESCRAYYESWAEPWERQALIKARFVAGDPEVGRAFIDIAEAFAYRSRVEDTFIASIRENKRRIERKVASAGETETNVKEGHGGIRDIEFTIQLLQLIAGGKNPSLRTPNTIDALDRLADAGLLTAEERETLASSYIFLRDVEHRLQIMDELPVRNLPTDPHELDKFGRRLGYAGGAEFMGAYRSHTARVHNLLQRLFYGRSPASTAPRKRLIDTVLDSSGPSTDQAVLTELAALGYADPKATLTTIRRDIFGTEYGEIHPDARAAFVEVADALITAAASTSDPDAALRGIDSLAVAVPSRFALYRTLSENRGLLPRLAKLAAESPYLWQMLIQHQEFLDLVADQEAMETPLSPAPPPKNGWKTQTLAQWIVRARLRTGARDIWGLANVEDTLHDVTVIGETALRGALAIACVEEAFTGKIAIIGMGKLGGSELGYSSDYDVLYVSGEGDVAGAAKVAKRLQQILKTALTAYGLSIEVDARLRPEGRKGGMALDIPSYRRYWAESALLWERQAHLKARFVAGDAELGKSFMHAVSEFVYGSGLSDEQTGEIRAMKRRIEKERAHSAEDLKLGPGGLSDIEWICQLLQLRFGHSRPRLRRTNTLTALIALRDDARLRQDDWDVLDSTYRALTTARNHAFLKAGVSVDTPSPFPEELRSMMQAARAVCMRVFYGE